MKSTHVRAATMTNVDVFPTKNSLPNAKTAMKQPIIPIQTTMMKEIVSASVGEAMQLFELLWGVWQSMIPKSLPLLSWNQFSPKSSPPRYETEILKKISSAYNLHFASEERLTEMHNISVFLSTSWRMEKVFDYNIRQIGKVLADFYQT